MLKFDDKQVTKNLSFNITPGSFKGKKVVMPVHKTKHGILAAAFKLSFKDFIKLIFHRRIYLQQVPNKTKADGIYITTDPRTFEKALQENEEFFIQVEGKEAS